MKKNLMSSLRLYTWIIYLIVALALNCEKDYAVIDPLDDLKELPIKQTLVINPDSGTVGTRLKIHGIKFHPSPSQNLIDFEGVETFRADSGTINTIYTYVPFGASSGSIEITYWNHDTIGVFDNFKFISECGISIICVIPYNLNVVLTEKNARQISPYLHYEQDWSGEINNDTVIISRDYAISESGITQTIKFLHSDDLQLPQLLSSVFIIHEDTGGERKDTLQTGVIKIQDWDTSSVVNGRVIGKVWEGHNYIFWYDFSK